MWHSTFTPRYMCPKENLTHVHQETCTTVLLGAQFILAKKLETAQMSFKGKWINCEICIAWNEQITAKCINTDESQKHNTEGETNRGQ